ncbi:TPA: hypothetical protein N0F65_000719 [Lagenidium giganteum]|uniref:Protein kinase domain-containing protein n=1 Tax=Lagenidium giganteum TaxID=4803 RepID=A0AAV2ZG37_9STRA|nr:TPA: hypothetical protein N0F65_000719 [Lagenidium giganteum]
MNVLLTSALRAKLTDFGVSRSVSHQTTMTAEVGTLAWIAPEVLNGERYTEKADIYSFGVILSEIDTLRQPYQNMRTDTASMANNAHIAFLVGAGQLRPDFTSKCPPAVRALAERCLAQSPDNRPSASELVDGLHGTSGLSK